MEKDFLHWFRIKPQLHLSDKNSLLFKERDIWWCSIGINVGDEADGKNEFSNRPVLIVKKFNRNIFYGLPMTTRFKDNPYYLPVTFHDKHVCIMLSQMRLLDRKRLQRKMGQLNIPDFIKVQESMKVIFSILSSRFSSGIDG